MYTGEMWLFDASSLQRSSLRTRFSAVKYPYCLKDTDLKDYPGKSNSCLKSENGATSLKKEHAYYYQSQQQIFTTGYNYRDFVLCGFNEQIAFFCERILPDICHWNSVVPKLNHF